MNVLSVTLIFRESVEFVAVIKFTAKTSWPVFVLSSSILEAMEHVFVCPLTSIIWVNA